MSNGNLAHLFVIFQDTDENGIPNSLWSAYESGQYVMYARAYDAEGNVTDVRREFAVELGSETTQGPEIKIFSKTKGEGYVSVNFEISPSNVEEAYVRMMSENMVDDRLNMGYELHELAIGGDAEDVTNSINTMGEYTFTSNEVPEQWNSILIYAKDKDGNRTTLRQNFYPDTDSNWSVYDPVYKAPARKAPAVKSIRDKRNPNLGRKM